MIIIIVYIFYFLNLKIMGILGLKEILGIVCIVLMK